MDQCLYWPPPAGGARGGWPPLDLRRQILPPPGVKRKPRCGGIKDYVSRAERAPWPPLDLRSRKNTAGTVAPRADQQQVIRWLRAG